MSWICNCKTCDCTIPCIHPTGYIRSDAKCNRCKKEGKRAYITFHKPEKIVVKKESVIKVKIPVDKPELVLVELNSTKEKEISYYELRKNLEN